MDSKRVCDFLSLPSFAPFADELRAFSRGCGFIRALQSTLSVVHEGSFRTMRRRSLPQLLMTPDASRMPRHGGTRRRTALANPIRIRDELSHHLSRVHDWTRELAGVSRRHVSAHEAHAVARA